MRARADAWKRPWGPGGLALDGRSAQDSPPPRKSPSRLRTRDAVDGHPRAVYRKFGLSRVRLRETAHRGELPGVRNASW